MGFSQFFLLRGFRLRGLLLVFMLSSFQAHAAIRCVTVLIDAAIAAKSGVGKGVSVVKSAAGKAVSATVDVALGRKYADIDHQKLLEASEKERSKARREKDLQVTVTLKPRKPEEVEAWLVNFSDRLKALSAAEDTRMPVDEFFGMVDGGFGRVGSYFKHTFDQYNINRIRLVKSKKFASIISKNEETAKDEIMIQVPDYPLDDPEAAAIWVKDLYLTMHDASTNLIAKKMTELTSKEANKNWKKNHANEVLRMDQAVRATLLELDSYLRFKNPEIKNPLNLASRSLSTSAWYHGVSLFKSTDTLVGGVLGNDLGNLVGGTDGAFYGSLAGVTFGVMTKVQFPLVDWKPSEKWLHSKEAYDIERERLDARIASYYTYRAVDKGALRFAQGAVIFKSVKMAVVYIQEKGLIGGAVKGLQQEKEESTEALNDAVEEQVSELDPAALNQEYNKLLAKEKELNTQKQEAIARNDKALARDLNEKLIATTKQMKIVMAKIQASSPEGIIFDE